MLCAYLDETGNTGSNLNDPLQRYHTVGAVVIPEQSWDLLRSDLQAIAVGALGKRKATDPGFEFHGNQLFTGNGAWAVIRNRDDRMKIFAECLSLLKKHKLAITYGRCDKKKLRHYSDPMHPHEVSFWLALERIGNLFALQDSLGFIVADDGARSTKQIARSGLDSYRKSGPPFGKKADISRIIDTVHFMNSAESPHLQICDLCLWVIQRYKAQDSKTIMAMDRGAEIPSLRDLYWTISARATD